MTWNLPRAPVEVEVDAAQKTILRNRPLKTRLRKPRFSLAAYPSYALRTLGALTAVGYLKRQKKVVSLRPSFSHLCDLIAFDPFRSCLGTLLLHPVLSGTKVTTERKETEEATCQVTKAVRLSEQQVAHVVPYQGWQQGTAIAISPLPREGSGVNTET